MGMKIKILKIFLNTFPIIVMIGLIPLIKNDYYLTSAYVFIIIISFIIKYEKRDLTFLIFGFLIMTVSEYIFINTGVESFNRRTLFGIMPLWLPFLWSYAFMAIKRSIIIIQ